ncbi:uncharacterized protein LOC131997717 [Stomoxys calcitrans]|uniref:uncharacterized protein LOC131997717 n=1 Tax=Stomoxys calcitrans TaxID=35570 RepID=UPI0027E25529|nr:uncharacterized protein LOC131997717 [Stomoxys calcitrans]
MGDREDPPVVPPDRGRTKISLGTRDRSRSNSRNKKIRMEESSSLENQVKQNAVISQNPVNSQNEASNAVLMYDADHKGPYVVYVDKINEGDNRSPMNTISLSRLMDKMNIVGLIEVNKIGFGRAKLVCRNAFSANRLVSDERLPKAGYQPRILPHFVSKIGIIFGVPTDISEEELCRKITSEKTILKINRVMRTEKGEKFPTMRIKILFKGVEIPKSVNFYQYSKREVKHYISFGQCYRCYRFNHFAQHCKQKEENCKKCFHRHNEEEQCAQELKCNNCAGEHVPTERSCPAREKAYQIKRTMTIENLSYSEARVKYAAVFSNRFSVLSEDMDREFPDVNMNRRKKAVRSEGVINNTAESARHIHSVSSFAKVAKVNENRVREGANALRTQQEHQQALNGEASYVAPNGVALLPTFGKVSEYEKALSDMSSQLANFARIGVSGISNDQRLILEDLRQKINSQMVNMDIYRLRANSDRIVPSGI